MAVSPLDSARRLRDAAVDGRLESLADVHGLSLVVMFGSASRGQPDARDLDVAVGSRARTGLPSAGMRNILVHQYLEIDLRKVAMAVPLALSCYRRCVQQVAEFVSRVG